MESDRIKLVQHSGKNMLSGKTERFDLYNVFIDDEIIARVKWVPGSKLCWIVSLDPESTKEIEEHVADRLGWNEIESSIPNFAALEELERLDEEQDDEEDFCEFN